MLERLPDFGPESEKLFSPSLDEKEHEDLDLVWDYFNPNFLSGISDDEHDAALLDVQYRVKNEAEMLISNADWRATLHDAYSRNQLDPHIIFSILSGLRDGLSKKEMWGTPLHIEQLEHLRVIHQLLYESLGLVWKNRHQEIDLYNVTSHPTKLDPDREFDERFTPLNTSIPEFFTRALSIEEGAGRGAIKTLQKEFGLTAFQRYPPEMLIKQFSERTRQDVSYGFILAAHRDENTFLDSLANHMEELEQSLPTTLSMRFVEARNGLDAFRKLATLHRRYPHQPWKFGMVVGHGWWKEQAIAFDLQPFDSFAKGYPGGVRIEHLLGPGIRRLADYFSPTAEVILVSCYVGGEAGFASELSQVWKRRVHASEDEIGCQTMNQTGVDADGTPHFDVGYLSPTVHPVIGHVYEGGKRIE